MQPRQTPKRERNQDRDAKAMPDGAGPRRIEERTPKGRTRRTPGGRINMRVRGGGTLGAGLATEARVPKGRAELERRGLETTGVKVGDTLTASAERGDHSCWSSVH